MDKTAIYDLNYGLYVIGTVAENMRPTGCIVNTVFQITSNPMRIAVSVNHENFTAACIENSREFTVSVISTDIDPAIIGQFGFQSGRDSDKFAGVPHDLLTGNMPVLTENITSWLHCRVENVVDVDTHCIFIAEVIDARKLSEQIPMSYSYYHQIIKGSAPKNAPTYREEEASGKYVCSVCKYEYPDDDFEALSDDWVCPVCKAPKSAFMKS